MVNKWADYLISAMRITQNSNHRLIAYFKVHKDKGECIGAGTTWTEDEVINAIKKGNSFITIYKENNGRWKKGSGVQDILIDKLFQKSEIEKNEEIIPIPLPEF